ncbi:MAG: hypothetical protein R3F61_34575 [Myxococcota bacterium]
MDSAQNPSANATWAAPEKPMVPKLPPAPEPSLLRPTGWSPTAWRFSKDGGK